MITLPYGGIPYICQDLLKTVLTAVFIEVEDKRLISLSEPITDSKRVETLRSSKVIDTLLELLDLFGEEGFIEMIKPNLKGFVEEVSLRKDLLDSFERNFKDIK